MLSTRVVIALTMAVTVMCDLARADGWQRARATWYDDAPWMSVHSGSCMYGYLGDRFGGQNNWMVGAINDGNPRYSGSCGRCYEMKCVPGTFSDALGHSLDRTHDCKSQNPVIVAITDTCPCFKDNNAYSNKRWCCGDMQHFDVGVWAFRQMADPGKGVILIDVREVSCPSGMSVSLNHGVQKPSSLRSQYPWQPNDQPNSKITAFSGPPSSSSSPPSPSSSPSSPASPSPSKSPSNSG